MNLTGFLQLLIESENSILQAPVSRCFGRLEDSSKSIPQAGEWTDDLFRANTSRTCAHSFRCLAKNPPFSSIRLRLIPTRTWVPAVAERCRMTVKNQVRRIPRKTRAVMRSTIMEICQSKLTQDASEVSAAGRTFAILQGWAAARRAVLTPAVNTGWPESDFSKSLRAV
jgi:hypothetical protein